MQLEIENLFRTLDDCYQNQINNQILIKNQTYQIFESKFDNYLNFD